MSTGHAREMDQWDGEASTTAQAEPEEASSASGTCWPTRAR
jgi:hypothetical protein